MADSGRLYAFGSDILGQLGTGSKKICAVPTHVKGPFIRHNSQHPQMETSDGPRFVIHRVATGGDHCFVIASDPEVSSRHHYTSSELKALRELIGQRIILPSPTV